MEFQDLIVIFLLWLLHKHTPLEKSNVVLVMGSAKIELNPLRELQAQETIIYLLLLINTDKQAFSPLITKK